MTRIPGRRIPTNHSLRICFFSIVTCHRWNNRNKIVPERSEDFQLVFRILNYYDRFKIQWMFYCMNSVILSKIWDHLSDTIKECASKIGQFEVTFAKTKKAMIDPMMTKPWEITRKNITGTDFGLLKFTLQKHWFFD